MSGPHVVLRHSSRGPVVNAGARHGANRLSGEFEHLVAYAGSAAIGMAGYGPSRGGVRVIGGFWVYAAVLEYLQHFSPGRHPSLVDFAASAFGALCGGLAVALLWRPSGQLG